MAISLKPPPANTGDRIRTHRSEPRLIRIKDIIHGDASTDPPTPPLVSVGRSTILEWEAAGKFPKSLRVGNCRFYRYASVIKWIEQGGQWRESDNQEAA